MRKFIIPAFIFAIHFQSFANQNSYDISSFEIKSGKQGKSNKTCFIPTLSAQQSYIIEEIHRIHLSEASHTLLKIEKNRKYLGVCRFNLLTLKYKYKKIYTTFKFDTGNTEKKNGNME